MNIYNLFPIAIGKFELDRELTDQESNFMRNQEMKQNSGNESSSNNYLLQSLELKNLNSFLEKKVDEYFQEIYAPKHEVFLRITQSWLNRTSPGKYHHKHAHPNSFISGVFYVKASKSKDKIYFYRELYEQLMVATKSFNVYNSESWWIEVGSGELILFPSRLAHMVQTVQDEDRISLAFNTFPVGYLGDEDQLTASHIRK